MSEAVSPSSPSITADSDSQSKDTVFIEPESLSFSTASQLAQSVEISRPHPFVIVEEHFSVSPQPAGSSVPNDAHSPLNKNNSSLHSPSNAPSESSFSSVEPILPTVGPEMSSSSAFSFLSSRPTVEQSQSPLPAVPHSAPGSTASSVISPEEEQWMLANAAFVADEHGNSSVPAVAAHDLNPKSEFPNADNASSFSVDSTGSFLRWIGMASIVVAGVAVLWTVVFG
jgi:hypothetical protein